MKSSGTGWVPGALFGLGTTAVQVMIGGLVGWLVRRKGVSPTVTRHLGLVVAARTLGVGGIAFIVGGLFGIGFPHMAALNILTGLRVHNLDHLGLPLVLVVVSVAGVGVGSLITELRRITPSTVAPAPLPHRELVMYLSWLGICLARSLVYGRDGSEQRIALGPVDRLPSSIRSATSMTRVHSHAGRLSVA